MFIYTYLKEYFYFVYYFKLRRALPAHNISMLCCVVLLMGDGEVWECQEVTFTKEIFECRWPVTEQTWLLAVSSTR